MTAILGKPLTPLILVATGLSAGLAFYGWAGVAPSQPAAMVFSIGWLMSLQMWLETDARLRRMTPCFDFAFLAGLAPAILPPWHCVRTRGWGRGLLLSALLVALWMGPYVAGAVAAIAGVVLSCDPRFPT